MAARWVRTVQRERLIHRDRRASAARVLSPSRCVGAAGGDRVLSIVRLVGLAAVVLTLGCSRPIDLSTPGRAESELATLVDSEPARRLLADLLAHYALDPRLAALPVVQNGSGDLRATHPR